MSEKSKNKRSSKEKLEQREAVKKKILNKKGFLTAERLISKTDVLNALKKIKTAHSDVITLSKKLDGEKQFTQMIDHVLSPFMLERLSVFAEHYPVNFERHVFCGWLSSLVAREIGLDENSVKHTVVAALARDIGLLYLPEKLLDESSRYSSNDWKAMKTHTLIGEILTRDMGNFNETEIRAVLEHHERHDGMGYPKGLKGKDLSIAGQIVGAVDTVAAIRFKRFEHSGRNLRDVYSYIQMNETAFNPKVNAALFSLLVKTGIENSIVNPFKQLNKLVSHLYVRAAAMNGAIRLLERLQDALVFFESGPKRNELLNINAQVMKLIQQSGILDKEMLEWLNSMDKKYEYGKADLAELSELELLQNELYWHLKRVNDFCQEFYDTEMNKRNPTSAVVSTILHCLSEKNLPRAAASIKSRY